MLCRSTVIILLPNFDFLINKKGELVVLNIDCANQEICDYVKSRLNYKKIASESILKNKVYRMPLVVKAN